jgi:hypothetical protein
MAREGRRGGSGVVGGGLGWWSWAAEVLVGNDWGVGMLASD